MRLAVLETYVPRSRNTRLLAAAAAVDSIGSGVFLALIPVFVVQHLGADVLQVGLVTGAANLLGLLAPFPAGWLADRTGAGRLWSVLLLSRSVGYTGFLFVGSFTQYAVLTCVLAVLDRASTPVQQMFVVQVEPPERRSQSMAVLRTVRNAGLAVGLFLSSVVIAVGSREAFSIGFGLNAASYLVLLAVVRRLNSGSVARARHDGTERQKSDPDGQDGTKANVLKDWRYTSLLVGNAILLVHDSVLFTLLPLWVVSRTEVPAATVGPLLALNTVLTVLLQVPLTRWANDIGPARRTVLRSLAPLLAAAALFAAAEAVEPVTATVMAVLAVVLLTLGENMHSVAAFELSHRLAPERSMGSYLGAFNLGTPRSSRSARRS